MWRPRPRITTDVLPTNPPLSLPHEPPTFWGSHAHWHDGLRTARTDRVWMGWNCVGDPLRSSDGWALFWVADDPLCDGWWMVDGAGRGGIAWSGMATAGWCAPSHAHSLSRLSSLVSRLSRWLGWPRSSVCESRRTTPPYHHMFRTHQACMCLPRVIHPQCMHDHKGHVATSPSHHHGCPPHLSSSPSPSRTPYRLGLSCSLA